MNPGSFYKTEDLWHEDSPPAQFSACCEQCNEDFGKSFDTREAATAAAILSGWFYPHVTAVENAASEIILEALDSPGFCERCSREHRPLRPRKTELPKGYAPPPDCKHDELPPLPGDSWKL